MCSFVPSLNLRTFFSIVFHWFWVVFSHFPGPGRTMPRYFVGRCSLGFSFRSHFFISLAIFQNFIHIFSCTTFSHFFPHFLTVFIFFAFFFRSCVVLFVLAIVSHNLFSLASLHGYHRHYILRFRRTALRFTCILLLFPAFLIFFFAICLLPHGIHSLAHIQLFLMLPLAT